MTAAQPARPGLGQSKTATLLIGLVLGLVALWPASLLAFSALAAFGFIDSLSARFIGNAVVALLVGLILVRRTALIGLVIGITPFALYIFLFDVYLYSRPAAYLELGVVYATTAVGFLAGRLLRRGSQGSTLRHFAAVAGVLALTLVLALAPSLAPGAIATGHPGWRQFSPGQIGFGELGYSVATPSDFNLGWDREGHVTFHGVGHHLGVTTATSDAAATLDEWEREMVAFNQRLEWDAPDSVEDIQVAGRPARLLTYNHRRGIVSLAEFGVRESTDINAAPNARLWEGRATYTLQAILVDDGTAFIVTSASELGDEKDDRRLFLDVLSTFRLTADD